MRTVWKRDTYVEAQINLDGLPASMVARSAKSFREIASIASGQFFVKNQRKQREDQA